jgi:Fe2+ or Zn2+ uptake regulation protein
LLTALDSSDDLSLLGSDRLIQHPNYHVRVSNEHASGRPASVASRQLAALHREVGARLGRCDQRYTPARRILVEALSTAARPLTVPELVALRPDVPQSSAYRNVTALMEVGVVRRVAGTDDHGRFELTEDLSGHHHHFACVVCGKVEDLEPSARLEQALAEAARVASEEQDVEITEHRFDFVGRCSSCKARQ